MSPTASTSAPGRQQGLGDLRGVGRALLPIVFDAIGRHVVEQGGAMDARRSRAHERRPVAEEGLQPRQIAIHDRVHRHLELLDGRASAGHGLDVGRELRPALEPVLTRDDELRVRERKGLIGQSRSARMKRVDRATGLSIAGPPALDEILCGLPVKLEVRSGG